MNFKQFLELYPIGLTAHKIPYNPDDCDYVIPDTSRLHYLIILTHKGKSTILFYSSVVTDETGNSNQDDKVNLLQEILIYLVYSSVNPAESYQEWCDNLWLDSKSEKTKAYFYRMTRLTDSLKNMLGNGGFNILVNTEWDWL